jgi:predicted GNAT superfamily acetyltransferase
MEIFSIRRAAGLSDCKDCNAAQRVSFGIRNEIEIIPVDLLRAICENGGLILNAYDRFDAPIGTSVAFLGERDGRPILYSQITGVIPSWQSKGVGLALKLEQRNYALEKNLDLICWTYDPMQKPNSWFNLNKLGTVSRHYYVNYYGELTDSLNLGIETDRVYAEWWVKSRRVDSRINAQRAPSSFDEHDIVNMSRIESGIRRPPRDLKADIKSDRIMIEIPFKYDFNNVPLLREWRESTRKSYRHYLNLGYATDLTIIAQPEQRCFVQLTKFEKLLDQP